MPTPHDSLFHYTFSQPTNAADLARTALPPALASSIDWGSLTPCDGKLTDGQGDGVYADLLFTVQVANNPAFLFLLLEHKSKDDPLTAFQLLRYMVRIWDRHRVEHPATARLPPILSVVVHHGAAPWSSAPNLRDAIDVAGWPRSVANAVLARQPELRFVLDDLANQSEAQLAERVSSLLAKAALLCMQHLRGASPDDAEAALRRWRELLAALHRASDGQEAFLTIVTYVVTIADLDRERLRRVFAQINPSSELAVMTSAGRIVREALQQGRAEGKAEGRAELVLRLVEARFGTPSQAVIDRIGSASTADLDQWAIRLLDAKTLQAVFDLV